MSYGGDRTSELVSLACSAQDNVVVIRFPFTFRVAVINITIIARRAHMATLLYVFDKSNATFCFNRSVVKFVLLLCSFNSSPRKEVAVADELAQSIHEV